MFAVAFAGALVAAAAQSSPLAAGVMLKRSAGSGAETKPFHMQFYLPGVPAHGGDYEILKKAIIAKTEAFRAEHPQRELRVGASVLVQTEAGDEVSQEARDSLELLRQELTQRFPESNVQALPMSSGKKFSTIRDSIETLNPDMSVLVSGGDRWLQMALKVATKSQHIELFGQ